MIIRSYLSYSISFGKRLIRNISKLLWNSAWSPAIRIILYYWWNKVSHLRSSAASRKRIQNGVAHVNQWDLASLWIGIAYVIFQMNWWVLLICIISSALSDIPVGPNSKLIWIRCSSNKTNVITLLFKQQSSAGTIEMAGTQIACRRDRLSIELLA